MIKLLRTRAIDNPWFFRGIMLFLAVIFIISLGWWGTNEEPQQQDRILATVDDSEIFLNDYRRTYKNVARLYRRLLKEKFDDNVVKKQVIDQLVDEKLWLHEAVRMNLSVSDAELREWILKQPGFQKNGTFNAEQYELILSREKLSPPQFERQQRDILLANKAIALVRQSAMLTPAETSDLEKNISLDPAQNAKQKEDLLTQKQERVVRAYALGLKQKATITISEDLL